MPNKIKDFIKTKETKCFRFVPNKEFYKTIGINSKRWGMVLKNKAQPTYSQMKLIAKYLETDANNLETEE